MVLVIYMLLGVAFSVVAVVALPLLLPQPKRPPEADKSPGPPKLAIKIYLLGVICSVRPLNYAQMQVVVLFSFEKTCFVNLSSATGGVKARVYAQKLGK